MPVLQAIYENLSNYEGKKITLNGFVIKTDNCKQNQFFLARIYLFCCAACAQPIGFYCEWEKTETLPEEQWVKITAVIDSMPYPDPDLSKKFIIPLLKVENVEDIEAPETPYVYPQW